MIQPRSDQIKNVHIRYYSKACEELGIPYTLDLQTRRLQITTITGKELYCYKASTPLNLQSAVVVSKNKREVHRVIEQLQRPTPTQVQVKDFQKDLIPFFTQHKNIVIKPADSHGGMGVTVLPRQEELESAYLRAKKKSPIVLAETYVSGDNYRFLVLDQEVLAVSIRKPPQVTGDGTTDIKTLFSDLNLENKAQGIPQIPDSPYTWEIVKNQGFEPTDIPAAGQTVSFRLTANLSLGGTVDDVTDTTDDSYKELAVRVTRALGLRFAGVDIIAEDLTISDKPAFVIEVNAAPGMRIHYKNVEGAQRNVALKIMSAIYNL